MRKKTFIILLVNIFIFLSLLSLIEYSVFKKEQASWISGFLRINPSMSEKDRKSLEKEWGYEYIKPFNYSDYTKHFRPVLHSKYNSKKPVVLFGCSYTEGMGLGENQTIGYKLYQASDRTIYNRGVVGTGPQFILYQLKRPEFKTEIPDAEYFIYTFIGDHLSRPFKYQLAYFAKNANLRYEERNGELQEVKSPFLPFYSLFTVKKIQEYIVDKKLQNDEEVFDTFVKIMCESKNIVQAKYPNSKFVILLYKDSSEKVLTTAQIDKLKSLGFVTIDAEKLVGHELLSSKYRLDDNDHPSEKAWDEVVPKLVKELNL